MKLTLLLALALRGGGDVPLADGGTSGVTVLDGGYVLLTPERALRDARELERCEAKSASLVASYDGGTSDSSQAVVGGLVGAAIGAGIALGVCAAVGCKKK